MTPKPLSNQVVVVHLSDIHFGDGHRFSPDHTPSGEPAQETVPDLLESLTADLDTFGQSFDSVLVTITGDLTVKASDNEFGMAQRFLDGLAGRTILGKVLQKRDIFVVPGNHDVRYDQSSPELFWQGYYNFYSSCYQGAPGRELAAVNVERFCRVHDRASESGYIVLELSTCHHNYKNTPDLQRGFIDQVDISALKTRLMEISEEDAKKSVKIALLHHHPVLIPAFAEPGRNYDAVINSGLLLNLLNDFGFQIILHGHKHNPHAFLYDATCGWHKNSNAPMLVVAGGSAGSSDLPEGGGNTYNLINIRHNYESQISRIQVVTRGLNNRDQHNRTLPRPEWTWKTIKQIDRTLEQFVASTPHASDYREFDNQQDGDRENLRNAEYDRLRQNMPVVEVVPSLKPGQEFEARMKIVGHPYRNQLPKKVVWSAGSKFAVSTCLREKDNEFKNTFSYYGPMLIQVSMTFDDETECHSYVYAHTKTKVIDSV